MGVALKDILMPFKREIEPGDMKSIAAIDAFNSLYQFLSIIRQPDGTPLMDDKGRVTSHLSGIFFRAAHFLQEGIKPVWVFDGTPPDFKNDTINERRILREESKEKWKEAQKEGDLTGAFRYAMSSSSVNEDIIRSARELIKLMGMPVIDAPSEGEAQAAYMAIKGDVNYVISQDYDTLLFGAPVLIRNMTISGKRRMHGRLITIKPEKLILSELLNNLSLSRDQLIEIAILTGTDFHPGVKGIGAKTGLKKVKNGEFNEIIKQKLPDFDPEPVREFFMHPPVTDKYTLDISKPDGSEIRKFLCDSYGFSEDRISPILEKITNIKGQKTLESWF